MEVITIFNCLSENFNLCILESKYPDATNYPVHRTGSKVHCLNY